MIPFNIPLYTGKEEQYISDAIQLGQLSGDGVFTKKCHQWVEKHLQTKKALLTTSCTHALEMTGILSQLKLGDEVIMSPFTFVSTANAFALRGATIVFVDIRPDTMNIDERLIESAITDKTKLVLPMHYAGVACEMDTIMDIANRHNLIVVEDAAQGILAKYKDQYLGSIGDFGTLSFHETKNIQCGEGGALMINNENALERSEIIREKGTNRSKFLRGQIDKYTWVDIGSSYLPSELNASFLSAQLELAQEAINKRVHLWNLYYKALKPLAEKGVIELPFIPKECEHNGHIFYIKCKDINERGRLIKHLKTNGIRAVFHYIPLHTAPASKKLGTRYVGEDTYSTIESERLLRLPMFYDLTNEQVLQITKQIATFYA